MVKRLRLTGLPEGAVDTKAAEVRFTLTASTGQPVAFVARYGVLSQVIAGLARMAAELRRALQDADALEAAPAEEVTEGYIRKDRWRNAVVMELETAPGTRYRFALPSEVARDIADRLKTESEGTMAVAVGQAVLPVLLPVSQLRQMLPRLAEQIAGLDAVAKPPSGPRQ